MRWQNRCEQLTDGHCGLGGLKMYLWTINFQINRSTLQQRENINLKKILLRNYTSIHAIRGQKFLSINLETSQHIVPCLLRILFVQIRSSLFLLNCKNICSRSIPFNCVWKDNPLISRIPGRSEHININTEVGHLVYHSMRSWLIWSWHQLHFPVWSL